MLHLHHTVYLKDFENFSSNPIRIRTIESRTSRAVSRIMCRRLNVLMLINSLKITRKSCGGSKQSMYCTIQPVTTYCNRVRTIVYSEAIPDLVVTTISARDIVLLSSVRNQFVTNGWKFIKLDINMYRHLVF